MYIVHREEYIFCVCEKWTLDRQSGKSVALPQDLPHVFVQRKYGYHLWIINPGYMELLHIIISRRTILPFNVIKQSSR